MNVPTSLPFFLGLIVIILYSWGRFDEPSFPKEETLPSAVVPLRYLFLRPAYARARLYYVTISATLYFVLVLAGQPILSALGISAANFPPEAWPLAIALLMVGVVPNPNMKWINLVEERLRRQVHAWFLVPDGVKETIAVLQDAGYAPPVAQIEAVREPLRSQIRNGLTLPRTSLQYRWARAAMLMEAIDQMGNGDSHPLAVANFEAFQDDLNALRQSYRALRLEIEPKFSTALSEEDEAGFKDAVDRLLRRIYAYISWGVRHQSQSDRVVFGTLVECGFRVPSVDEGRRLFDILFPAYLAVVVLVSLVVGVKTHLDGDDWVVPALTSAMAAGLMYGGSAWIALQQRARMIEDTTWHPDSSGSLVNIAWRAGLATWAVIVIATVFFGFEETLNSLKGLWVAAVNMEKLSAEATWLPTKLGTAAPWFLAGATFSVLLASRLDGDLRRQEPRHRARDAMVIGVGLAAAVIIAQVIQDGLSRALGNTASPASWWVWFGDLLVTGATGLLAGCVMGFTVPAAFRREITKPARTQARYALRDLLVAARLKLGGELEAQRWAFTRPEDDTQIPITPAEALRYRNYATGVRNLLDEAAATPAAWQPSTATVIEGGRKAG